MPEFGTAKVAYYFEHCKKNCYPVSPFAPEMSLTYEMSQKFKL